MVCSARAQRYDLDDKHNLRCRDTGRVQLEHTIWNHNDVGVTDTRRERCARVTSISGTASSPSGRWSSGGE